jgi:hypothetical protein
MAKAPRWAWETHWQALPDQGSAGRFFPKLGGHNVVIDGRSREEAFANVKRYFDELGGNEAKPPFLCVTSFHFSTVY